MKYCKASVLALLLVLPLSAWAGKKEADLSLTAARSNVAAAERADAGRHATVEMSNAREMLARAEHSYQGRDWTNAEREADRAKADARLAEARSRLNLAESQLAELERTIQTLREEIARRGA